MNELRTVKLSEMTMIKLGLRNDKLYFKDEVDNLIASKDRTIRDYEDNYLPRPKNMELKCWMIGSPETGEQWVYDAEEVDRVISTKDHEIADLKKKLAEYEDCDAKISYGVI